MLLEPFVMPSPVTTVSIMGYGYGGTLCVSTVSYDVPMQAGTMHVPLLICLGP